MRKLLMGTALAAFALTAPAFAGVVNGGFESGDTGFSSGYTSVTSGVTNTSCYPAATYAVVNSPDLCHNFWASFPPHSGNLQLVANGAGDPTTAVWSETLSVTPFTTYNFDAWAASSYATSPATLSFAVNGNPVGTLLLPSTPGLWTPFSGAWNSLLSTSATLEIFDLNTDASGNDFTLDDISFAAPTRGVPEPLSLALFGGGLAGIGAIRRRRKAKS